MNASSLNFRALYLELVESTNMLRTLLAGITPEEARFKPDPESWSILETLCHLHDEERLDFRTRLDAMLNRPGQEWPPIDPQGWVTSKRYNEQDFHDLKERFFSERSQSLDWLKGLEGANWMASHTAGAVSLTAGDMLASWAAHDNLALRQLVELRRARLERISEPFHIEYAGEW